MKREKNFRSRGQSVLRCHGTSQLSELIVLSCFVFCMFTILKLSLLPVQVGSVGLKRCSGSSRSFEAANLAPSASHAQKQQVASPFQTTIHPDHSNKMFVPSCTLIQAIMLRGLTLSLNKSLVLRGLKDITQTIIWKATLLVNYGMNLSLPLQTITY